MIKDLKKKNKDYEQLIEEVNGELELFNAEKHLIKAKLKTLLTEYCSLDEDSYNMDDDSDKLEEYLEKLEKALSVWKQRTLEESRSLYTQRISELEDKKLQLESDFWGQIDELNEMIEGLKQENEEMKGVKDDLEELIQQFDVNEKQFKEQLENAKS